MVPPGRTLASLLSLREFLRAPSYSDKPNLSLDDFLVKHTRKTCFLTYVTSMAIFTSRISLAWLSFLVLFLVSSKRAQLLPNHQFPQFSIVGVQSCRAFLHLIDHTQTKNFYNTPLYHGDPLLI